MINPDNIPLWKKFRDRGVSPETILRETGIAADHVPVDTLKLARLLGIEVFESSSLGCISVTDSTVNSPEITMRADLSRVDKRLVIAQGIGHLMLHNLNIKYYKTNSENPSWQEIETRRFAMNLVMPEQFIINRMGYFGLSVPKLAQVFDVSEVIMSYRLQDLHYL